MTGRIFGVEGGKLREYYYEATPGIDRTDRPWTVREVAGRWKDIVKRATAGAAVQEDDLDALIMRGLPAAIDPAKAPGWSACIHFSLVDGDGYTLVASNGRTTTSKGLEGHPTCVVTTDSETLYGVLRGDIDGSQAYMKGKLKVSNLVDITKMTEAFDAATAKAAQARGDTVSQTSEDLSPRGLRRQSLGARFRGSATLATANDSRLLGATLVSPLLLQATSMVASPEAAPSLALRECVMDILAQIRPNDLVFPVVSVSAIDSSENGDTVEFEAALRIEGELIHRHVLTSRVGRPDPTAWSEHSEPPDFSVVLDIGDAEAVSHAVGAIAAAVRDNTEVNPPEDPPVAVSR
ncbi:MAG: SCP2 sterol-binding domain-containing protein, partial [bacterium]|nr:SCP2 sterol-binding domain-containing protein [bacterium]